MKPSIAAGLAFSLAAISAWLGWNAGHRQGIDEGRVGPPGTVAAGITAGPGAPETGKKGPPKEAETGADEVLPSADSPLFATRVREVFADPFENRRLARLQLLLEKCGPEQFAAIVPLIHENDLRGTGSGEEWELVMQNWARKDGSGVMAFIGSYDWKGWHPLSAPGARYEALVGWATNDPGAALAYFEDPANAMTQDSNLQRALIKGWVARDPNAAALWVLAPEQSGLTTQAHQLIVDAICRKGGQALLESWFAGLPQDSPGLAEMAQAVSTAKNRFQPEKAAEWIESQKGKPWIEGGSLVTGTARQLAEKDPAAALAWAGRTGSEAAIAAAMQSWCGRDVGAASEWLRANPTAPHYDQAAVQVIRTIAGEDPEAARAWSLTIRNEELRKKVMDTLPEP